MEVVIKSETFGDKIAYIDEGDIELFNSRNWHLSKARTTFYLMCNMWKDGKNHAMYFHRIIMGFPKEKVDHKDRNGLNNSRDNLRLANDKQSARNKGKFRNNRSGYKGVYLRSGRFAAIINANGRQIHGGRYDDPLEAAFVYNELALKYHGEYAGINNFTDEQIRHIASIRKVRNPVLICTNTSGYRGIYTNKSSVNPYGARISVNDKTIHLGKFKTLKEAVLAYNKAAKKYHKKRAVLNPIPHD
jgi:hypothetical protein